MSGDGLDGVVGSEESVEVEVKPFVGGRGGVGVRGSEDKNLVPAHGGGGSGHGETRRL